MRIGSGGSVERLRGALSLIWSEAGRFVKVRLGFILLLVLASSVLTALAPVALKWTVDAFTSDTTRIDASPLILIVLYVLGHWTGRILGEIRVFVHAQVDRRMYKTLSDRLFGHIMQLPLRFHLDRQTGAISEILTNGVQGYQIVLQALVYSVLPVVVELGTVIAVLVTLDHSEFMGLFCIALSCYAVAFGIGVVRIGEPARAASSAQVEARAVMTDCVLNYETVKYFSAEPLMQAQVHRALSRTESEWMRFFRRRTTNGLLVATIFAGFLGLTVFYAAQQVRSGAMTVGDFVLVNAYLFQLVRPVEMAGIAMQQIAQGFAFLAKMLEVLRQAPELRNDSAAALTGGGTLEFENVCAAYHANRPILTNVSFNVPAGKTLGIVGVTGGGKSTLVRLLVRLIEPEQGRILLDGVPVSNLPLVALRQAIAVVPQDTALLNDTIRNNIAVGKPGSSAADIQAAAKVAHLHAFVMGLPDGYNTRVGERGVKLSGGEKQRVSIARAVLMQPRVYVFDEATSSLDSRTERAILRSLWEISRSTTTLVIAHRLSTIVRAHEIVVLDQGMIVERGTHKSLLQLNRKYASLWQAQQAEDVLASRAASS